MLVTKGGSVRAMAEAGVWPFSHDATGSKREREGQFVFRSSSTKKDPKTANRKKPAVSGQHNNDDYGN